jgi:hypothetical protein
MSDGLVRDEVVVRQRIVVQCLFEFGGARKAGLGRSSLMRPLKRVGELPSPSYCRSRFRPERDTSGLMKRRVTTSRVIQGQFQQTAQFDDDQLLRGGERRMQGVRPMRTVFHILTSLPFDDGGFADAVAFHQFAL